MIIDNEYAIIGVAPCGCVTCIVLDRPEYVDAETILEWVRHGLTVQRVTATIGRDRISKEFNCQHEAKSK